MEGLRLPVANVRPIVPLFDRGDGRGGEGGVSFYQAYGFHRAVFVDHGLQDDCPFNPSLAGIGRISRRQMPDESLFRTLRRQNYSGFFTRQFGVRSGSVDCTFLTVGSRLWLRGV